MFVLKGFFLSVIDWVREKCHWDKGNFPEQVLRWVE